MTRLSLRFLPALALAAGVGLLPARTAAQGGGTISGTVKAPGQPTAANAVVYVEQAPGAFKPPANPAAEMNQQNMQFVPHVLPVLVGSTVKFLNSDSVSHNIFSPDHEKYNLGTWGQGQSKEHTFAKCPKFPCAYTQLCMIHPEMEGFVVVLQNPYFAVTDAAGTYTIKDVPAGKYTLAVWHEKLKGKPEPVAVEAGKSVTADFALAK